MLTQFSDREFVLVPIKLEGLLQAIAELSHGPQVERVGLLREENSVSNIDVFAVVVVALRREQL